MEQKTTLNQEEIISRLSRLESEILLIKEKIKSEEEKQLEAEMKTWEQAGTEDSLNFFKEHNL
jgi:hypothetical protein|tara:strand:+ start:298 stop:486 length:189 start_codon:yes stop_codon:yes gene_type:complete